MTLDRVAGAGLGFDSAVGPAQPTAAQGFDHVLNWDRLVRFAVRVDSIACPRLASFKLASLVAKRRLYLAKIALSQAFDSEPLFGFFPNQVDFMVKMPVACAVLRCAPRIQMGLGSNRVE